MLRLHHVADATLHIGVGWGGVGQSRSCELDHAVVFAQELVEADGAAHGKLKKSGDVTFTKRKWPGKGCKNKALKQKKSGPRRTNLLLWEESL